MKNLYNKKCTKNKLVFKYKIRVNSKFPSNSPLMFFLRLFIRSQSLFPLLCVKQIRERTCFE